LVVGRLLFLLVSQTKFYEFNLPENNRDEPDPAYSHKRHYFAHETQVEWPLLEVFVVDETDENWDTV
jgi:hypothetical protein